LPAHPSAVWRFTGPALNAPHKPEKAGRGRGLATTAAVEEGQLLMVAAPLGVLYCEVGRPGGGTSRIMLHPTQQVGQ
jgi:hypothetical protein